MTGLRSGLAGQRRLRADLGKILTPRTRPSPPVIIWRWRYELAVVAIIAGAVTTLLESLGLTWGIIATSALAGLLGPPWPRSLTERAWCVITPHRLRAGFAQARIWTARGHLPAIIRTTRAPYGERVLVWCPAGTSAEDLRAARALLRAACWAADIQVARDEQRSQLVTIRVIRHAAAEDTAGVTAFRDAA